MIKMGMVVGKEASIVWVRSYKIKAWMGIICRQAEQRNPHAH